MNPERLPRWEGDFWAELLEEQGVSTGTPTGRFAATGGPDAFFYGDGDHIEGMSPYWTDDTLVGEIVEEGQLELDA